MKHIDLTGKLPGNCEIWHLGDFHVGAAGFSEKVLRKYIKAVEKGKNIYYSLGGDMIDTMNPHDPRFKFGQTGGRHERASDQIDYVLKLLKPIKEKCLWVIHGNHEMRVWNTIDVAAMIAKRLETTACLHYHPNQDMWMSQVMVKVLFDDFKLMDHHGVGLRVNSKAGRKKRRKDNERETIYRYLRDLGGSNDCIATMCHHIHKIYTLPPTSDLTTVSQGNKLRDIYPIPIKKYIDRKKDLYYYDDEERWYGTSGGFFGAYVEGVTTYGEYYGFRPVEMGCIKTVIRNHKFKRLEEVKL